MKPHKQLLGMTFTDLTVIADEGSRKSRAGKSMGRYWRCRCRCGQETVVQATNLLIGKTKSCGCRARRIHDSQRFGRGLSSANPGTVYGRLTIISAAEPLVMPTRIAKRVRCRCECGEERVVMIEHLRSGQTQSCGCAAKAKHRAFCLTLSGRPRSYTGTTPSGKGSPGEAIGAAATKDGARPRRRVEADAIQTQGAAP